MRSLHLDRRATAGVSVLAVRHDGRKVKFAIAPTRAAAEALASKLRRIGLAAEIVDDDEPGPPATVLLGQEQT